MFLNGPISFFADQDDRQPCFSADHKQVLADLWSLIGRYFERCDNWLPFHQVYRKMYNKMVSYIIYLLIFDIHISFSFITAEKNNLF